MSGVHRFWSLYADETCSGAPSGVYIRRQNDCPQQLDANTSLCVAEYLNDTLVGYMNQSCHDGRAEGLDELYQGKPYVACDYYWDGDCANYDNTVSYQVGGQCEALVTNDNEFRSGIVYNEDGMVNFTRNEQSPDCPGESGSGYYPFDVSDENVTHATCTNYVGLGGLRFYNSSTAMAYADSSGSSSSDSSGLGTGAIVGIAVGVVAALVVAILVGCCIWKRKKRSESLTTRSLQDPLYARASGWTGGTTAETEVSTLGPGLWTDEAIIASRVPRDQVTVEALVSRGGFGEIYRGKYNREDVAIKMLFPEMRSDLKKVNSFLAEAKLMAGLSHPHIVRFVGVSWGSLSDLCVLTEFMRGGDLRALLKGYEAQRRPQGVDEDKLRIAYQIAQALTYLHSLSPLVIHRDLKSNNVLLTENLDAKLTDFGVSRERELQTMTAGVGTMLWMAPEIMMGERYDEKADIFSFGVLLSELDQQTLPYAHARTDSSSGSKVPDAMILQKVTSGVLQVAFSAGCLPAVVQLGQECVALDPAARPSSPMVVYRLQTIIRQSFGH